MQGCAVPLVLASQVKTLLPKEVNRNGLVALGRSVQHVDAVEVDCELVRPVLQQKPA